MQAGEDGAVDEKGELLPVLSKSATRMKYDKLIKAPLPQFSGEMPGSYFWTNFAYFLLRKVLIGQFFQLQLTLETTFFALNRPEGSFAAVGAFPD